MHFAALFAASLAATAAFAQDSAQLLEQAKRRWAESPHGPMLERILPPTFEPRQLPERKSRGARLVVQYCVQCHNLPNPAMHHAEKWPAVFERMVVRMRGRGNLGELMHEMMAGVEAPTVAEAETLLAYLQKYSQRALDPRRYPAVDLPEEISRGQSAGRPVVQARLPAVPRSARSATLQGVRVACGGGAHGEEHGVDEYRRRQPPPAGRTATQDRRDQRLPRQVREERLIQEGTAIPRFTVGLALIALNQRFTLGQAFKSVLCHS